MYPVIDVSELQIVTNSAGVPLFYWDGEEAVEYKFFGAEPLDQFLMHFDSELALCPEYMKKPMSRIKGILSQGTYVPRLQRNSTKISKHAYGTAIDFAGFIGGNDKYYLYENMSLKTKTYIEALCSLYAPIVLHDAYNSLHWNHIHITCGTPGWRGGRSQIQLIQRILNAWYEENLCVDGIIGVKTLEACGKHDFFQGHMIAEDWFPFLINFLTAAA